MSLILGTRESKLARIQSAKVLNLLQSKGISAEERAISTEGDRNREAYIHELDGIGVFEREIDSLVLTGEIDGAVHSMKDLPSDLPEGLKVVAVVSRNWPRDALVSPEGLDLSELPGRAVVGTSAVRRRAQLLWRRSDLSVVNLRGNVDTRLQKLEEGKFDAIVIAEAGLKRLSAEDRNYSRLPFLPAANQGAIAVTARSESETATQLEKISEKKTELETFLEREIVGQVGKGCQTPLGVLAKTVDEGKIKMDARIFTKDGSDALHRSLKVSEKNAFTEAARIGRVLARWQEKFF